MHLCLGDRESSITPIEVCQDRNPTVTVARQDFRKCCICPHASDYGILVCSLCRICMTTATSSWVCSQAFCNQRCENSPSLQKTPFGVHGMFLYYDMTSRKYFFLGLMVLVSSLVPNLFRENPHLLLPLCYVSCRVPTGEPIANSIPWNAC